MNFRALKLQANFSTWWILNKDSMRAFLGLWPSFVSKWRNENYHYIALEKAYSQIDPIYRSKFYPVLFTRNSCLKKKYHPLKIMGLCKCPQTPEHVQPGGSSEQHLLLPCSPGLGGLIPKTCAVLALPAQLTAAHLEPAQKLHSHLWPQCRCTLRGAEQLRKLLKNCPLKSNFKVKLCAYHRLE